MCIVSMNARRVATCRPEKRMNKLIFIGCEMMNLYQRRNNGMDRFSAVRVIVESASPSCHCRHGESNKKGGKMYDFAGAERDSILWGIVLW